MDNAKNNAVDIWLARCPTCGSADLHHYGTRRNGRGETIRYYRCRRAGCRKKFPGRIMNAADDDRDEGIVGGGVDGGV